MLFYADVASDLKQFKLFYDQGLVDYMAFNAFALLIPPAVTLHEAFEWSRTPSPELSFFQSRIQSEVLQKIIIVAAVASQSHVLLLVMLSRHLAEFGLESLGCCYGVAVEPDSTNEVADSFNLIVDVVRMHRQSRHASFQHLLQGV